MIQASSANGVQIEMAPGSQMPNGIQRGGENIDAAAGITKVTEGTVVKAKLCIAKLAQHTEVIRKIESGAALNIPSIVQVPAGVANRLSESSAQFKSEMRYFLSAQSGSSAKKKTAATCESEYVCA